MRPFVSVIIPTYNRAHCLGEAICSAWVQRKVDTEIIVVDDASTDHTSEALSSLREAFAEMMPGLNMRVITHETNKGVSAARNTGIGAAKGEYIAFLDSDDLWDPQKLVRQFADLKVSAYDPKKTFCCTYYENRADDENEETTINRIFLQNTLKDKKGQHTLRKYNEQEIERGIIKWSLWFGAGSTLFAHREAIEKNGLFDEKIGCAEDTEYLLRHLVHDGKVRILPELLMSYLLPPAGKTYSGQDKAQLYIAQKYKCAIAQKWGGGMAKEFLDVMWHDYKNRNHVGRMWSKAAREVFDDIRTISPQAPCRDGVSCPLKGRTCDNLG